MKCPAYINRSLSDLVMSIDDLVIDEDNPQDHDGESIADKAASLKEFGQRRAIVANARTKVIVAGNGIAIAAKSLGWSHIAVTLQHFKSKDHERQFAIIDNLSRRGAKWNVEHIAPIMSEDLLNSPTIGRMMADLKADLKLTSAYQRGDDDAHDKPDRATSISKLQKKWKTKVGQLWEIGSDRATHVVKCGDYREPFSDLLDVEPAAVICDPPYGIGWKPRVNHQDQGEHWNDSERFDPTVFLTIGERHLFWGAQYIADLLPVSEAWLVWVKRPIDHDFSGDPRTYSTVELAWTDFDTKPGYLSHVWDGGKRAGDPSNRTFCHPSQKPVELFTWAIGRSGITEGVIFDPCSGSGTVLIAADGLGLPTRSIELSPGYVAVTLQRCFDAGMKVTKKT